MDGFASPSLPKSTCVWLGGITNSRAVGHSKFMYDDYADTGLRRSTR